MGELMEDDGDSEAEDPVSQWDDRIDSGQSEQRFGGRWIRADRGVLHEGRFPDQEDRGPDHREGDENDGDVSERAPETGRAREAVDQLPTPDRLPHQEGTRRRRRRLETMRLEEAAALERVEAEAPQDDDTEGEQEGEEIHHARLRTNLLVYFNLSRGNLAGPDIVWQVVVHREGIDFRLRAPWFRESFDPLDSKDPIVDAPHLAFLDHDLFLARRQEAFLFEHVEHVAIGDVEVVVNCLRLEAKERHQIVRESPKVLLGHPPFAHGSPKSADHFGHRDNRHSNIVATRTAT